MRLWSRHSILASKAKREQRTIHRHRWWKRERDFGDSSFTCFGCGKVITERMLLAEPNRIDLFMPIVKEQLESLFDTNFFRLGA